MSDNIGSQSPDPRPNPRQLEQLDAYLALMQKWNAAYNLTAIREPEAMRLQHLADCLAVVQPLRDGLGSDVGKAGSTPSPRILDVGSGGGLPGVVLAIMNPDWQVSCIDTVGKKAAFVRQVAGELGLPNLQSLHARVETLKLDQPTVGQGFDLIVSRAFASLVDFTSLTRSALRPGSGRWAAMKGRVPDDELAALSADIKVDAVTPIKVPGLAAERCLVWLRPAPN